MLLSKYLYTTTLPRNIISPRKVEELGVFVRASCYLQKVKEHLCLRDVSNHPYVSYSLNVVVRLGWWVCVSK